VSTQPPTKKDDNANNCQAWEEAVNQIRADMTEVKNMLSARQYNASDTLSLCKCFADIGLFV